MSKYETYPGEHDSKKQITNLLVSNQRWRKGVSVKSILFVS